jgi:hypothetical protein
MISSVSASASRRGHGQVGQRPRDADVDLPRWRLRRASRDAAWPAPDCHRQP